MVFFAALKHELQACQESRQTLEDTLQAIKANVATIEFTPGGEILDANPLFLKAIGYELAALQGQHHRILCDSDYAASPDYGRFWQNLAHGQAQRGTVVLDIACVE